MNVPVTDEMDELPSCMSKLDNTNKETTASHIPLLVWVMFLNLVGFNIKGRKYNNWIVCVFIRIYCALLIGYIMNNLSVVASLIILGTKMRR